MECDLSSPVLKIINDDDIKSHTRSVSVTNWDTTYMTVSLHTQAIERRVKLITEASGKVHGADYREGFNRMTLQA